MIFEDIDLIAVQLEGKREPYFWQYYGATGKLPRDNDVLWDGWVF